MPTWKEFPKLKLIQTPTDLTRKYLFNNHFRYANSKKILEINPSHPAIKELFERVKDDPDKETEDLATVLYEGAVVNSGILI